MKDILIVLTVLLLFLIAYLLFCRIEKFFNNSNIFTIVIARFNEDLEWLKESRFENHRIVCYNKGNNSNFYKHPNMEIIRLPNVGMCNHTYLYHIINNYDKLDNLTLFVAGSCMDDNKRYITNLTFDRMTSKTNSAFVVSRVNDVLKDLYDFTLDNYKVRNSQNTTLNDSSELVKCKIRPFGKFYEHYFEKLHISGINYYSIFGVSKEHILHQPKALYENLIQHVNKDINTEAAHYLERLTLAIFHPIPDECLIYL